MILRLPFTTAVGFDISEHHNFDSLNGQDISSTETDEAKIRRVNAETLSEDYVPIKMNPHAPLDEEYPLETDTTCLTIGQVDPVEKSRCIYEMRQRSHVAISGYRKDAHYKRRIPKDAEALTNELINTSKHLFCSKLTGRDHFNI